MAELPSYTSFYRRFRPQRFSEVLGQDHITKALRNAVAQKRISHAFLFSGPRGTGKTSTARILAKALNCRDQNQGEPCCACESCNSIAEGRSFDIIEVDAASNSKVEEMRSLLSQTSTASLGEWKVYILDEVHMLSQNASNALLKTLEEPPSHVIFVLATTDPQKVLPTIKSRAQHYEFNLLDESTLGTLIESIKERAGLTIEGDTLSWLVDKGGGSARDTLSYLDQVVALGYVPESRSSLDELLVALEKKDSKELMQAIDALLHSGQDPQRLCDSLISLFRSAFLTEIGISDPREKALTLSFSSSWLVKALSALGGALVDMKNSLDPRIILEVALIQLSDSTPESTVAELVNRIGVLEKEVQFLKARGAVGQSADYSVEEGGDVQSSGKVDRSRVLSEPERTPPIAKSGAVASPSRMGENMSKLRSALSGAQRIASSQRDAPTSLNDNSTQDPVDHQTDIPRSEPLVESKETSLPPSAKDIPTDVQQLAQIFKMNILPGLSPRARSLYSAARLAALNDGKIVLAVPNEAHKSHAIGKLEEVKDSFVSYFHRKDLLVELVSDEGVELASNSQTDPEIQSDLIEQFSNAKEVVEGGAESQIFEVFPGAKRIDS